MIYIIIPVFNRWHFTEACLNSLMNQEYSDFKIVVIDHGSTDGSREKLTRDFPNVKVLFGDESMWWSEATNLGVEYVLKICNRTDLILTLNNDLIVDSNYLQTLMNLYFLHKNSLIGSTALDIDDHEKIAFCGVKWNAVTAKTNYLFLNEKYSEICSRFSKVETDMLPGRGTLIPINVFKDLGLYDYKKFPHYAADQDLSLRAKKAGFPLLVSTKSVVYSHISETGLVKVKNENIIENLIKKFSSIKSPENLKIRYRWAQTHSRSPHLLYFIIDISRIIKSIVVNGVKR